MFSRFHVRSRVRSLSALSARLWRPRGSFASLAFAFLLGALLLGGAGCLATAASDEAGEGDAALGEVELPLIEQAPDGTVYRLRDAMFDIAAADGQMIVLDGNSGLLRVSAQVPPGLATLTLRPGWRLEQSADGVTFEAIDALYASPNPLTMRFRPGISETLRVDFLVRDPRGSFSVVFHADKPSQQLSGSLFVEEASGAFAPYLGAGLEFATYFKTWQIQRVTEADGGKSLVYRGYNNVTEFFNDEHGVFTDQLARTLVSGVLELRVTAGLEGQLEMSSSQDGYHWGAMDIAPGAIYGRNQLDEQGFPIDGDFSGSSTFTIELPDAEHSTVSGSVYFDKVTRQAATP